MSIHCSVDSVEEQIQLVSSILIVLSSSIVGWPESSDGLAATPHVYHAAGLEFPLNLSPLIVLSLK